MKDIYRNVAGRLYFYERKIIHRRVRVFLYSNLAIAHLVHQCQSNDNILHPLWSPNILIAPAIGLYVVSASFVWRYRLDFVTSLPFSRSPRANLVRFLAKSDGKCHIQFASHEFVFLILQLENSRSVLNNKAQQAFWKLFLYDSACSLYWCNCYSSNDLELTCR